MKFIWRMSLALTFVLAAFSYWLFWKSTQQSMEEDQMIFSMQDKKKNIHPVGLKARSPWDLGSLRAISARDRADFGHLYSDDRLFFGDGDEGKGVLKKDTEPYIRPLLGPDGLVLDDAKAVWLLRKQVVKAASLRKAGNLRRLFMAADLIRARPNLTLAAFRGVLEIQQRVAERSDVLHAYDRRFDLTSAEKRVLVRSAYRYLEEYTSKKKQIRPDMVRLTVPKRYRRIKLSITTSSRWYKFYKGISRYQMYQEDGNVDRILADLHRLNATAYYNHRLATRFHGTILLSGKFPSVFTPIRFSRTQETRPNERSQDDWQRHVAEIAAFHLDRVLGFRRAVPTTGRIFNMFKELKPVYIGELVATPFVKSLSGNDCMVGECKLHCSSNEIICGTPNNIESAMSVKIDILKLKKWEYPWKEAEGTKETAPWAKDQTFCSKLRKIATYHNGRRLLDIIELAIFDFLQGNRARTEYYTFAGFDNDSFIIHNDNERGFGRAFYDDTSILAPLYQCCIVRFSTLHTLIDYALGPTRLSDAMWRSLVRDPLQPVLLKQHLLALDRRLKIALKVVYECMKNNGVNKVVIAD